jgi:hypothetical protein
VRLPSEGHFRSLGDLGERSIRSELPTEDGVIGRQLVDS